MGYFFLAGRVLYGGSLLLSGIDHFRRAEILTVHAGSKGVPAPRGAGWMFLLVPQPWPLSIRW